MFIMAPQIKIISVRGNWYIIEVIVNHFGINPVNGGIPLTDIINNLIINNCINGILFRLAGVFNEIR